MCDCYMAKCPICGDKVSFHLADYATGRDEIVVFHKGCAKKAIYEDKDDHYSYEDGKISKLEVTVICLTQNAIDHKKGNHIN